MLKKLNWNVINDYLDKDLLMMQKHPDYDLYILNYSKTCQFEKVWDEISLSCRGLVVNGEGKIIARPFKKFFNKEELENDSSLGKIPTNESFEVFEKMDGSCIILFYYKKWIAASRGSFTSDQAIKANEMLKTKKLDLLDKNKTYMFEIIY